MTTPALGTFSSWKKAVAAARKEYAKGRISKKELDKVIADAKKADGGSFGSLAPGKSAS